MNSIRTGIFYTSNCVHQYLHLVTDLRKLPSYLGTYLSTVPNSTVVHRQVPTVPYRTLQGLIYFCAGMISEFIRRCHYRESVSVLVEVDRELEPRETHHHHHQVRMVVTIESVHLESW